MIVLRYAKILKTLIRTLAIVAAISSVTICQSCSSTKNTAANRNYQAFITRYNVYYNGDEHYKETLRSMEDSYEDDYSRLLSVHPVHAYDGAKEPGVSFSRSADKARKAIQLRSIKKRPRRKTGHADDMQYQNWLKREEYNPFLHNAWLLLGKSQFMDGNFSAAISTFSLRIRHFSWLPETVTESRIWLAWAYTLSARYFEAEKTLSLVNEKKISSPQLLHLYYLVDTDLLINTGKIAEAIPVLSQAVKGASGSQKIRLNFLLGQLLELEGNKAEAYRIFGDISRSQSAPYRTKFNARIKQSEVFSGPNVNNEIKSLRSMLRYGRNKEYADQILYAIGNLYLSRNDTTHAIEAYRNAIAQPSVSGLNKALAQLRLGQIYFDRRRYDLAQPEYAEALPLLPENFPDYKNLSERSDILDELAVYSRNVVLQDSLLELSLLPPDRQLDIVNKIIADLIKREKSEAEEQRRNDFIAENTAANAVTTLQSSAAAVSSFTLNNDKSWYFYNDAAKNAGRTEFQKRWGNRKLEDDWRRHNKSTFSFSSTDTYNDSTDTSARNDENIMANLDSLAAAMDPHKPEYYLKQIPSDDIQRTNANNVIQQGLYNMGVILKDRLEDYPAAEHQFATLLSRYPDNIYRLDTYNNLFLMHMRMGNRDMAETYRQLVLSEFPESKLGYAMRDPDFLDHMARMNVIQDSLYNTTYRIYLDGSHPDSIHTIVRTVKDIYSTSPIMPKFLFLDALAYVNQNDPENFGNTLRQILEQYPESDVSPLASSWLRELNNGRDINPSDRPVRGMIWTTRLSSNVPGDSATVPDNALRFDFTDPGDPMVILAYPVDSVSPNLLLYDVARHNFSSFTIRDFDLQQMNFGNLGLLTISGFKSQRDIQMYLHSLTAINLPPQVRPIIIGKKNFELLITSGGIIRRVFQ